MAGQAGQPQHGLFDQRELGRREAGGGDHREQQFVDTTIGTVGGPQRFELGGRRRLMADEAGPELRDHEGRRRGLGQGQVDHVVGAEVAGAAQQRFLATVVPAGPQPGHRGAAVALQGEAGQRAGGRGDVGLGVVAVAEGEQLQVLAGEVLVGRAGAVLGGVQPHHQRRVDDQGVGQRAERRTAQAAERLVLGEHQLGEPHLLNRGREVPVPEPGQPLAGRVGAGDQLRQPPGGQGHGVGAQHHPTGLLGHGALTLDPLGHLLELRWRRGGRGAAEQSPGRAVRPPPGERVEVVCG